MPGRGRTPGNSLIGRTWWPCSSASGAPAKASRDIVFSINRQGHKLYHLGLSEVKRSTLSDANKLRPAVIFEKTYYKLYERLSAELAATA